MITEEKLLLISPDTGILRNLRDFLSENDFQIKHLSRLSEVMDAITEFIPDIILLDSTGNEIAALEFCSALRSMTRFKNTIIIFLSEREDELIEISAFRSGADDFVAGFSRRTALLERMRARNRQPKNTITIIRNDADPAPLKIDRESFSVSVGNEFIQLSKKEFELLYLMASNPDKLFRREEIFRLVWNKKMSEKNRTIDVHILRLRQKLGNKFITTQKGMGYRFST